MGNDDRAWLLDEKLTGADLVRRAYARATRIEDRREVQLAALEVAALLSERLDAYWAERHYTGEQNRDARDPTPLALTLVRLQVHEAAQNAKGPEEGAFVPGESERDEFERARAEAEDVVREVFGKRLRGE